MEEKEKKDKEEKGEARKDKWEEKVQRKERLFLHGEVEREKRKQRRPKEKLTSHSKTSPEEVGKMALSPSA